MMKVLPLLVLLLFFASCAGTKKHVRLPLLAVYKPFPFKTKLYTALKTGDNYVLFYHTNSCCKNCLPDTLHSRYLKYMKTVVVITEKPFVDGGTTTHAMIYRAENPGIEKIKMGTIHPDKDCYQWSNNLETYTIKVFGN